MLIEGTGAYRQAPFEVLRAAAVSVTLVNAYQVKQLKDREPDVAYSFGVA